MPAFLEPRCLFTAKCQCHFVANEALVGADWLVERVRVDLVDGNAIAVDATIDCRRNRMYTRARESTNKAKADSRGEAKGGGGCEGLLRKLKLRTNR